jgi:hypothetical protein
MCSLSLSFPPLLSRPHSIRSKGYLLSRVPYLSEAAAFTPCIPPPLGMCTFTHKCCCCMRVRPLIHCRETCRDCMQRAERPFLPPSVSGCRLALASMSWVRSALLHICPYPWCNQSVLQETDTFTLLLDSGCKCKPTRGLTAAHLNPNRRNRAVMRCSLRLISARAVSFLACSVGLGWAAKERREVSEWD